MCTYIKKKNNFKIPSSLEEVLIKLTKIGATPILVGGCVRDTLLNLPIKDFDIEVFNIKDYETLQKNLEAFGKVQLVGKSFGVIKLNIENHEFDFALPRCEIKTSSGHKGFKVTINPNLSFKEAAIRRDFTINSIGYDYFKDELLDPFLGLKDLENKILKYINEATFIEDPLRVYRAVGFASRFNFTLDNPTFLLCQNMIEKDMLLELPKERVFEEFKKVFLKSSKPSIAFSLLKELGALKHFSELEALIGCEQEFQHHPEGDVWIHTLMTLDEMVKLKENDDTSNIILFLAILCHDLGKPLCTKIIDGKITSYKHESLGLVPTKSFLNKLTDDKKLISEILALVQCHLIPFSLYLNESSTKAIKRLSLKVNIQRLCKVCLADCLGRDIKDKSKCSKGVNWLLKKAQELEISTNALEPLVQGRDLISLGYKAGVSFKSILSYSFELQIQENLSKDELLKKVKSKFNN